MKIPSFVHPFLWSYDIKALEQQGKKKSQYCIIKGILNFGNSHATNWLFENYSKKDIKSVIKKSIKTEWDKKSLNLWSLIFKVKPQRDTRF